MTAIIENILLRTTDAKGNSWRISQRAALRPGHKLIFFIKHNAQRKLLDQCGEWTPSGWHPGRFVPSPPRVPEDICRQVESLLRVPA